MTESTLSAEPVFNVIEQDVRGPSVFVEQPGGARRTQQLDAASMEAVSARRRREFDAARARLRDQVSREVAEAVRQPAASLDADGAQKRATIMRAPLDQPPERVRKRYLRAGNQYFLKDAPYQLAFEDLGPYLVTEHNRPDVVESMIDIASARSWTRVRVSGHEAFRSDVWLQGTLLGINVSGYDPKAADLARLADARRTRPKNRMELDPAMPASGAQLLPHDNRTLERATVSLSATPDETGGTARPMSAPFQSRARDGQPESPAVSDEPETPRHYAGELREHGHAPYLHNPARSGSYYVEFCDASGIGRVVWGVDLERAILASRAEPGDHVTVENLGRRVVAVKVLVFDDNGTVVGEKEKDVYRNAWKVDVVQRERPAAGSEGRPEHASSMATVSANVRMDKDRQEPRLRTVSHEDKVLHLAVLAGAMREQGFSPRSIARVQRRAEAMLDAFDRQGVELPRPRVFDPNAPSERDRWMRAIAGGTPAHEIERTPSAPSPAR